MAFYDTDIALVQELYACDGRIDELIDELERLMGGWRSRR